jgi:hypothetical protein
MSTLSTQLTNIIKQNDSIYSSLVAKGIEFVRTPVDPDYDEPTQLELAKEENGKLKELAKNAKPPNPPKPVQEPKVKVQVQAQAQTQTQTRPKDEDNDDDETFEEPVKKFDTITNMEEIKRDFFNGELEKFDQSIKSSQLRLFRANYKYNGDKDGAPEFAAKNLLKGFVKNFEGQTKYFMVCFRCWKEDDKATMSAYSYESLWIINTPNDPKDILGGFADDFDFVNIELTEPTKLDPFLESIRKITENSTNFDKLVGESWVH